MPVRVLASVVLYLLAYWQLSVQGCQASRVTCVLVIPYCVVFVPCHRPKIWTGGSQGVADAWSGHCHGFITTLVSDAPLHEVMYPGNGQVCILAVIYPWYAGRKQNFILKGQNHEQCYNNNIKFMTKISPVALYKNTFTYNEATSILQSIIIQIAFHLHNISNLHNNTKF